MEPVVVVGAGPVGLVTALLLARHRVPSVVLEADARRDPSGSRAICFQRDVLDVLDRAGCAGRMIARGVTWTTGRTYHREVEDRYGELDIPVLVAWGREDGWLDPHHAERLAEHIPRARLRWLDGAGHLVQEDAPARLTGLLTDFLGAARA